MFMFRRMSLMAALAAVVAVAVTAVALGASAGSTATLTATAGSKYVINKYAQDTSHFAPGAVTIKSGGTLTVKSQPGPPHTLSFVKETQLPKTTKQIEQCKVCETLAKAHGADPNSDAPPTKPVVDVGATGIDQAGDSVFLEPGKNTKLKITAKKGKTLYFICAIHPWMQGKLQVK
jgi:plastocyanin